MARLSLLLLLSVAMVAQGKRDCTWMKKRLDENLTHDPKKTPEIIDRIYPYSSDLEALVNYQIKVEMDAFYSYLAMSHFFARDDNDRPGFAKHFHKASLEELDHAEKFMKYQAKRGGRVKFFDLKTPKQTEFANGQEALRVAMEMEKKVTDEVLCLHQLADEKYDDVDFVNFLEGEVIPEQYEGMKEITTQINTLQRMASGKGKTDMKNYGIAEYHFDEELNK